MTINSSCKFPNTAWRQKWMRVVNGVHTHERFHTWHDTKSEAETFFGQYFQSLGNKPPKDYYLPVDHAKKQFNIANEPKGKFLKDGVLLLSPL
jgi:hypothetical protein